MAWEAPWDLGWVMRALYLFNGLDGMAILSRRYAPLKGREHGAWSIGLETSAFSLKTLHLAEVTENTEKP